MTIIISLSVMLLIVTIYLSIRIVISGVATLLKKRNNTWIYKNNELDPELAGEYFCSHCGSRAEVDLYGEWILSKFCPNCGAFMRGKEKKDEC